MLNKNTPSSAPVAQDATAKKPNLNRTAAAPSIMATDLIVTGDIKTDGDIQIDGRLDGNIKAGTVTIGEQGSINGKITAKNVYIRGKMTGKVDAVVIELAETANVQADLIQDQLVIANGAFFDGKCSRKSSPPVTITKDVKSPTSTNKS